MTEREWDKRLRIRTSGREDEANANYSSYEPTPYSVLERLAQSGYIKRKHRLLDYGCGKGRVAFFMASAVGCRAMGIDQSQKLIDMARENRRSSRVGDRTNFACCLAEQYEPKDEDVFFFFNPFSLKVFESVLRRIERSRQSSPRDMTLISYYPSEEYAQCLDESPSFFRLGAIDCRDLFGGRDPRERILVYFARGGE